MLFYYWMAFTRVRNIVKFEMYVLLLRVRAIVSAFVVPSHCLDLLPWRQKKKWQQIMTDGIDHAICIFWCVMTGGDTWCWRHWCWPSQSPPGDKDNHTPPHHLMLEQEIQSGGSIHSINQVCLQSIPCGLIEMYWAKCKHSSSHTSLTTLCSCFPLSLS